MMTELGSGVNGDDVADRLEYVERQLASLWRQTYRGRPYVPHSEAALPIPTSRETSADVPVEHLGR
jgi:hypothetical protein